MDSERAVKAINNLLVKGHLIPLILRRKVMCHHREVVNPAALRQAVKDLMGRLPFFNVGLYPGFRWYYHRALEGMPPVYSKAEVPAVCAHFPEGRTHLIRFLYGERDCTVEVLHTLCDGRSLARLTVALLVRYFEILGLRVDKEQVIDCEHHPSAEEAEDGYSRFADLRRPRLDATIDAYQPKGQACAPYFSVTSFNLPALKARAEKRAMTVTEYILACIASEFAAQRQLDGSDKPVAVNVPIDCRTFFPTRSLRPFVTHTVVRVPETVDKVVLGRELRAQFASIRPEYIQMKISEIERYMRLAGFLPLFVKRAIIRALGHGATTGCSTGFSNLGLVRLPKQVGSRVDMVSFALGPEPNIAHQFAAVASGTVLSLTATSTVQDSGLVDRIGTAILDW